MAQFADVSDLGSFRGRAIASGEVARATLFLQLASAKIQNYTSQQIELVENDQIVLHPQDARAELQLPQRPVIAVSSVTLDTVAIAGYEFTRWGRVRWGAGGFDQGLYGNAEERYLNPTFAPVVAVTYTHGYETIPDDVRAICVACAARGMENPTSASNESIGAAYQVSRTTADTWKLLPDEKRELHKYRLSAYSAPILGRR